MQDRHRLTGQTRIPGAGIGDPHEAVGLTERQRPEEQRADDAVDRGRGADAEADDEDGEDREAGVAPQHAERVAQILEQRLEGRQPALIAVRLAELRGRAQRQARGALGLLPRHPAPRVVVDEHREMRLQLVIEVSIERGAPEEGPDAGEEAVERGPHGLTSPRRARAAGR